MDKITDIDFDFTHKHAGNGWAIIQNLGDNNYRVVAIGRNSLAKQAFVAWGKKLEITRKPKVEKGPELPVRLEGEILEAVKALRSDLKSGRATIGNNGHILSV